MAGAVRAFANTLVTARIAGALSFVMMDARLSLFNRGMIMAAHLFRGSGFRLFVVRSVREGRDDRRYKSNYRNRTDPSSHTIYYTLLA